MSNNITRQPYTFDRVVRILFTVVIIGAILFMLNLLKGVLLPFFVACLIAYMLEPIVRWHMRLFKTKSRYIPIILTLIEVIAGIIIFGWLFIPYVVDEVAQMANMLKKYADIDQSIPFLSDNVIQFIRDNIDWNYISRLLTKEEWLNIARNALSS